MFSSRVVLAAASMTIGFGFLTSVGAEPGTRNGERSHHQLPAEAIDACNGKTESASCSFVGRRGEEVSGSCIYPLNLNQVVCAPEGGPPHHRMRKEQNT